MKVLIEYVLAKFGFVRITPNIIRLSTYQESFLSFLHAHHEEPEIKYLIKIHLDNQIALTKQLRSKKFMAESIAEGA